MKKEKKEELPQGWNLQDGGGGGGEKKTPSVSNDGIWIHSYRNSIGGRGGWRGIRIIYGQGRYTKPGSCMGGKYWKVVDVHIKG